MIAALAAIFIVAAHAHRCAAADWPGSCSRDRDCEPYVAKCGHGSITGTRECVCEFGWNSTWLRCNKEADSRGTESRLIDVITSPRVFSNWDCNENSAWAWCTAKHGNVALFVQGREHISALFDEGDTSVVQWLCIDAVNTEADRAAQTFHQWCKHSPLQTETATPAIQCTHTSDCPARAKCFKRTSAALGECHCITGFTQIEGRGACVRSAGHVYKETTGAVIMVHDSNPRIAHVTYASGKVSVLRNLKDHLWPVDENGDIAASVEQQPPVTPRSWSPSEAACPVGREYGLHCQMSALECAAERCNGAGACTGTLVGCSCRPGRTGPDCGNPDCGAHGTAQGTGNCECEPGYTGPTCTGMTCGNGGWWNGTACQCRGVGVFNATAGRCMATACGDPNAWLLPDGTCGCPAGATAARTKCKRATIGIRHARARNKAPTFVADGETPEDASVAIFVAVTAALFLFVGVCGRYMAMKPRLQAYETFTQPTHAPVAATPSLQKRRQPVSQS